MVETLSAEYDEGTLKDKEFSKIMYNYYKKKWKEALPIQTSDLGYGGISAVPGGGFDPFKDSDKIDEMGDMFDEQRDKGNIPKNIMWIDRDIE